MKKIMCVLCLLLVLGCKSKKRLTENTEVIPKEIVALEKLSISEVDKNQKSKAYELGKRVLMTCNTSKFKPFNESEATLSVIKNTTQSRLTKTCLKFRLRYGEFKDLQLIEIFKNNIENTTIFRYKAFYEKKIANKELRVTMNNENKISAIKSKDWVDLYQ